RPGAGGVAALAGDHVVLHIAGDGVHGGAHDPLERDGVRPGAVAATAAAAAATTAAASAAGAGRVADAAAGGAGQEEGEEGGGGQVHRRSLVVWVSVRLAGRRPAPSTLATAVPARASPGHQVLHACAPAAPPPAVPLVTSPPLSGVSRGPSPGPAGRPGPRARVPGLTDIALGRPRTGTLDSVFVSFGGLTGPGALASLAC